MKIRLPDVRLDKYKRERDSDESQAITRYDYNIQLSSSLYPALHIFEVSLRNTIHNAFKDFLGDDEWLINYENHDLIKKNNNQVKNIKKAIQKLSPEEMSEGKLIAELNLGFWVSLYHSPFSRMHIRTLDIQFPKIPRRRKNRESILRQVEQIRELRNRIFHFEPVWYWENLNSIYQDIKDLINWMEPNLFIKSCRDSEDEFKELIERQNLMTRR